MHPGAQNEIATRQSVFSHADEDEEEVTKDEDEDEDERDVDGKDED